MKKPIKFGQVYRRIKFRMKEGVKSALIRLCLALSFIHLLCSVRESNRLDLELRVGRVWRPVL